MFELIEKIEQADEEEIAILLKAVLERYAELFPDWEVSTVSVQKSFDRNAQLDRMIAVLQKMKTDL